ncbi:MAG: hypothetical protein EZS28_039195, partial [Streblomastix strix]
VELEQLDESRGRRVGIVYSALNTRDNKIYAVRKIEVKKYNLKIKNVGNANPTTQTLLYYSCSYLLFASLFSFAV